MNIKYTKIIILTLNIIAFLLGFIFIFSYINGDICTDHDHFYPLETIKQNSIFHAGRWISSIFTYIYFLFIPKITNIHINDLTTTVIPFVNTCAISISSVFCLRLFFFFTKEKKSMFLRPSFFFLYPCIFLIIAILPLRNGGLDVFFFSSLHSVIRHYDHYFCYIFYVIFCYGIISAFYEDKTKKLSSFLYFLNAFLLGVSTETLAITASFTICIFILYGGYCSIKKKSQIEKGTMFFLMHNFFFLLTGALAQFFLSAYSNNVSPGYSFEIFSKTQHLKDVILPFLSTFKQVVIVDNIVILLTLLVFTIIILFLKSESKNKIIFLQLGIFLGFILESLFLFFLGDASQVYPIKFWIEYYPFRTMLCKTFFLLTLISGGYIINKSLTLKTKIIVYSMISICISYIIGNDFKEIEKEFKFQREEIKDLRTTIYKADKIALTYYLYDGIAILPISFYEKYSQHTSIFRPRCKDSIEKVRNEMIKLQEKEIQNQQTQVFTWLKEDETFPNIDYLQYLELAYGIKLDGVKFVSDEIAYIEFERRNGQFTEKELSSLKFTNLRNKYLKKITKKEIDNLISENPNKPYLYASRCRLNYDEKKYNEALSDCTKAIKLSNSEDSKYSYLYFGYRANIYQTIGNTSLAIKDYKNLIEKEFFFSEKIKMLAEIYENEEQYDKAIKLYKDIINVFPYIPVMGEKRTYYNKLAELSYKNNELEETINYLNKAEEYNKEDTNYFLRAIAKLDLGKKQEAIMDLNLAKKYNPENTEKINQIEKEINKNRDT